MNLVITKEVVGKKELHSSKENPERIEEVPLYKMIFGYSDFSVTRDTNHKDTFKKLQGDFSENSECPPNKKDQPYKVILRTDGNKGPRLQLYEEEVDDGKGRYLQGIGQEKRDLIQIHKGKWSTGCFLVQENKEFQKMISEINIEEVKVHIEPR